ncbi:MAG: efflux RND transporter permease subunit, partial [Candidatus Electrothrix sp. GM3_4]|nr:efflux RND transporter permease subunit [Candidatus Electrothrix sp. GM3_4]
LFFNLRISFWVVMGLPVSFFGAFFFLPLIGLTINMMSMVGLLLALGLMMDDAIVIAENIASHRQRNKPPLEAVITGVREVSAGVASSFVTTLCVLGPLAFIDGQIGKVLKVIPMILILVLAVSLVEAFCILPAHMGHAMKSYTPGNVNRVRKIFEQFIEWLREVVVGRTVDFLLGWRYLFIGGVVALFIFSVGMVASGKIKVQGFPEIEGDVIVARLLMPQGTPLKRTEQTVAQILQGLAAMNQEFKLQQPKEQDLVQNASVQFNQNADAYENGPHVATVTVDLLSAEGRAGWIDDYTAVWRQKIGLLPDIISLTLGDPVSGPSGRPIEIRVRGKDLDRMKLAIEEMKTWFQQFAGVINLDDDLRPGKPELRIKLRDGATNLGIDAAVVARQIRAGFHGITASELQVDNESYEIDVRFENRDQNSLADLENFNILVNGRQIPLTTVVEWEEGRGRSRIARHNGMRAITLRGDIDARVANANELIMTFRNTFAKDLGARYPELKITVAGESEESAQTQGSMMKALLIGLVGIFILLSFQFRSYTEPFIVMIAIPLSLIGVIWGHLIMGIPISMPSIMGFIALAGIVVNDSILLVLFLKNARAEGLSVQQAAGQASRSRFRAVLLTSATTIAGLLPLLFETSTQAQILIPLVVSTTFGLMASTLLVLLFIPCLYLVLGDFGRLAKIQINQ